MLTLASAVPKPTQQLMNVSIRLTALFAGLVGSATAASYFQNFDAFADGTTDLGDGTVLASNIDNAGAGFPVGNASVQGGELRFTEDNVNSQRASLRIPALPGSSLGWTATFDFTLFDAAGGNNPADGFSLNYGDIQALSTVQGGPTGHGNAEGGMGGTQIAYTVDTWQVGDPGNQPGVEILGAGSLYRVNGTTLADGGNITGTATISWSPGTTSYSTTGLDTNANFSNVAHTFVGNDAYGWAFSARTGGANEEFRIDNLVITTIPEPTGTALLGLAGMSFLLRRRR